MYVVLPVIMSIAAFFAGRLSVKNDNPLSELLEKQITEITQIVEQNKTLMEYINAREDHSEIEGIDE